MSILALSPSSSSPFLCQSQNPKPRVSVSRQISQSETTKTGSISISKQETERGLAFETGETFFRHESATGRDLGVLAGALHKRSYGGLRVVDAMCGCGVRSLRYLVEAEADFVLANDANEGNRSVIVENLSRAGGGGDGERWAVMHTAANRVLTECYVKRDLFDLIDVDSFGSESDFLRSAMNALRLGGLLYLTSTDGFSSGGHRPEQTLAAYGAYVRPVPFSNEIGLRMVIGGAVREASVLGYHVKPLFSYYSYHGPIFRVMLRMERGKLNENKHYGFISYCTRCGNSQSFSWDELGQIGCPCNDGKVSKSVVVLGPLWTGPLHDATYVTEMLNLAEQWGWISDDTGTDLEKLLRQFVDESDPRLPPGYIKLDEVAKRAKVDSPPLKTMMNIIHKEIVLKFQGLGVGHKHPTRFTFLISKEGYAACRSHIISNAIKTDCPMAVCIRFAKELQQ